MELPPPTVINSPTLNQFCNLINTCAYIIIIIIIGISLATLSMNRQIFMGKSHTKFHDKIIES